MRGGGKGGGGGEKKKKGEEDENRSMKTVMNFNIIKKCNLS